MRSEMVPDTRLVPVGLIGQPPAPMPVDTVINPKRSGKSRRRCVILQTQDVSTQVVGARPAPFRTKRSVWSSED